MDIIYYRSIFFIFIVFYMFIYFSNKGFKGTTIYVNRWIRLFLGRANGKDSIALTVVAGHILNIIVLLIGAFAHKFIDKRMAFEIYKYSIPIFWLILVIIKEVSERGGTEWAIL